MSRPGGIARAIETLRDRGLAEHLSRHGVSDAGDLSLPGPSGVRGDSDLLNEEALGALFAATRARVGEARERDHLPILVGGDCPVLLGALAAIRDGGSSPGLLMIDGHEDAWPPSDSKTGEASDSEVAIALGSAPDLPKPLADLVPLLDAMALAYLGPRDAAEIAAGGFQSLRGQVAHFASDKEIYASRSLEREAGAALAAMTADEIWVHVDLDVLSSAAFTAVNYQQPGGLGWDELYRLASAAVSDPRCAGASIVIYNPDLDPDRTGAEELIGFVTRLVTAGST